MPVMKDSCGPVMKDSCGSESRGRINGKTPAQLAKGSYAQPLPSDLLPPLTDSCPSHPKTHRQTNPGVDSSVVPCPPPFEAHPRPPLALGHLCGIQEILPPRSPPPPPVGAASTGSIQRQSLCTVPLQLSISHLLTLLTQPEPRNGSDHFTWFNLKAHPPSPLHKISSKKEKKHLYLISPNHLLSFLNPI